MSRMKDVHPSDDKSKDKIPFARTKITKRRPKDHPKRPLSAYNYFFKDQRAAIVLALYENDKKMAEEKKAKAVADTDGAAARLKTDSSDDSENMPTAIEKPDYIPEYRVDLDQETMARLKKNDGTVSFEQIGKLIGRHWKIVDPARLAKYQELAKADRGRYKKEMIEYDKRHEDRLRLEIELGSSAGSNASDGQEPLVPGTFHATYQDFRVPTNASAFSSVAVPSSGYSYGARYGMGQQGMYPAPYYGQQYGMGMRHQGTDVASMPATQYPGYGAAPSSVPSIHGSEGGYGYSRPPYDQMPPTSSRGSYEGGQPVPPHSYPVQSMTGQPEFEGNHPSGGYVSHSVVTQSHREPGEEHQGHTMASSNQDPAADHSGRVFSNVPFDGDHQPYPSHHGRMPWGPRGGG